MATYNRKRKENVKNQKEISMHILHGNVMSLIKQLLSTLRTYIWVKRRYISRSDIKNYWGGERITNFGLR